VGDLVCATPVFRAIKEKYPDSFLAVVTTNKVAGIIKNNSRIDQIIIYERNHLMRFIRQIRTGRFDWSFSLTGTSFGNLIFFAGLVARRAKITRADRPRSEILTDWMNSCLLEYRHHTYLPRRYLDILQFIDIIEPEEKKEVFVSAKGEQKAEEFWQKNNLSRFDKVIGISITAGNKIKEWGDNKFAQSAKLVAGKCVNSCVIFIGGKGDDGRISELMDSLGQGPYLKATDFNLEELPSLMKRLHLYVAVDTGPIYIAHALGVPLVDITGPVDPREQPPHDDRSICVTPPQPFTPSSFVLKAPGRKEEHKRSLERISVEMVMEVLQKLL
jgi:ADP-heptose:LPS heptosyltransferase